MKRPLAGVCACPLPMPPQRPDTRRPFACLRCRRVMRLGDMLTLADVGWLKDNRMSLGPFPVLPPPPEQRGGEEAAC